MARGARDSDQPRHGPDGYRRFTSLDGLRGLAALAVVIHHCLLVSPAVASFPDDPVEQRAAWAEWLQYTPLHFFWTGAEAVYVFFVLSGFVLCLPLLRRHGATWRGYYPRRLLRLYIPVWAAVGFALLNFAVVDHRARPELSNWVNLHDVSVRLGAIVRDLVLLGGTGSYNTPLWSLRWEMWFSLLLPAYVLLARAARGRWGAAAGIAVLLFIGAGAALDVDALVYMPMFGLGALMAGNRVRLASVASRLPRWSWAAIAASAVLLITGDWLLRGVPGGVLLPVTGAALLVFLFLGQPTAIRMGDARPVRWLGKRSFSLYLVHEPILVSLAMLLDTTAPWMVLAVGLPLALLAADLFFRFVEGPSHQLASQVGRRFGDRPERTVATAPLAAEVQELR